MLMTHYRFPCDLPVRLSKDKFWIRTLAGTTFASRRGNPPEHTTQVAYYYAEQVIKIDGEHTYLWDRDDRIMEVRPI